ncbi:Metallo-beta-lactamase superfamily protein [Pricia antarctica]|uniref:Metallo-beta-lactamase superfamily protein n=1 Tax=Pricia antarctica TaxID=641691 RepID=A0A1G6X7X5_9FLAO|nr:MBL fold metallo-hydrolase [Pricia antarctica]SDD74214.1 Metallo-beta-lactamase superfamily protein [Pricia antarctica]
MTLYPIETGNFKLDGGAMFGVVPKSLWQKTNPADINNMIDMSARCLLIEDGDRLILIDTGMGDKQSDKFFGYYYRFGDFSLDGSLAKHGFHRDDITDVFLTHLHFDHCGGCIKWNKNRTGYEAAFKNAVYWTNEAHWEWAIHPNAREKASFLKENLLPMQESGQLKFLSVPGPLPSNTDSPERGAAFVDIRKGSFVENSELGFGLLFVDGHTAKQMLPYIDYQGKKLVFVADLLPTVGHIPLPYVMGFDTRPLLTLEEKSRFLNAAAENGYYLFLEHDARNEICTVKNTEKGVRLDTVFSFSEIFS